MAELGYLHGEFPPCLSRSSDPGAICVLSCECSATCSAAPSATWARPAAHRVLGKATGWTDSGQIPRTCEGCPILLGLCRCSLPWGCFRTRAADTLQRLPFLSPISCCFVMEKRRKAGTCKPWPEVYHARESLPDSAEDHAKPASRQSPAWLSHLKPCVHLLGSLHK